MFLVALTGGIAAGKSTVAAVFRDAGAVVIDADQLARDAVAPGAPTLVAIKQCFGQNVFHSDGTLNRQALATRVFDDPAALAQLNAIVHPAVLALFTRAVESAKEHDPNCIVVYDVPLLVETARQAEFNFVVVVEAPDDVRIQRMMELRHLTASEAEHRVAAQASNEARRAIANAIIDTSGSLEQTMSQSKSVWQQIVDINSRRSADA